ncbi:MAG TPA: molybdenum cofactor guanylyltransferase [Actinomycetota bacterium]|nr:molybdenum cofactor guanylyltransferase [Actinomycetota bacterium]
MTLSGLVLAGGRSRRMGRDKALIGYEGETLVERAARRLAEVCDEVIIASGDGLRLPVPGCRQVADAVAGAGPLSGLVAGLEAAGHPLVAVAGVDMPHLSPALFRLLFVRHAGEPAVVPEVGGQLEPLHALYARSAAPALRCRLEAGERPLRAAVEGLGPLVVGPEVWGAVDPEGRFAENLNQPGDLDIVPKAFGAEGRYRR